MPILTILLFALQIALPQTAYAEAAEVVAPAPLTDPMIDYPEGVTGERVGLVAVRFTVDVSGAVTDVEVLASNDPAFAPVVVQALLATPFSPALQDGVAFAAAIEVEIEVPPPPPPAVDPYAATLSGTIFELGTRNTIAGAQIAVAGTDRLSSSDAAGRFSLTLAPGPATVVVTAPGFRIQEIDEYIEANERVQVVYRLRPETSSPLELIVEAERQRAEVSRVRLNTQELKSVPGTFDDAIRVVQKLPGVSSSSEVAGDLIVRGSDSRDTKIYLDGIQVPFVFHFGAIKSIVATELIQEVVLYPSNFSVRYGDAIGGVLDVRLKDPDSERWRGRGTFTSLLSEAFAEGPVGERTAIQLGARSSYAHLVIPPFIPKNSGVNFSTFPKFRDYQARMTHRRGPWTLRAFLFGAQDELKLSISEDRQLDESSPFNRFINKTNQHSSTLRLGYVRGPVTGETLVGFGRSNFFFRLSNEDLFQIESNTIYVRSDWEYRLRPKLALVAGLDSWFDWTDLTILFPRPPRPGEFDYDFFTAERLNYDLLLKSARGALYTEARIGRNDGVNGAIGLRYDVDRTSGLTTADPRGLLIVPVPKIGALKTGFGVYHQFIQDIQFAPAPVGNPDAGPNRAWHALLGWQKELAWQLDAQVEVFYKWLEKLITENPDPLDDPRYDNFGKGRVYGFEISLRKPLSEEVSGWINYSFSRSFRRLQAGLPEEPFAFDQPHVLNIVLSWFPNDKWEFGGAYRYASGNPRDELIGDIYFGDQATFIPLFGELNDREPDYMRLDLRMKRIWRRDTWSLAYIFEILNATNRKNVQFSDYNATKRERENVNGFPLIPYFGLEAKF